MLASKFIETELNAYIQQQRLTESPLMVKLICKAFEAYDEYRRLVSNTNTQPKLNLVNVKPTDRYNPDNWDVLSK